MKVGYIVVLIIEFYGRRERLDTGALRRVT